MVSNEEMTEKRSGLDKLKSEDLLTDNLSGPRVRISQASFILMRASRCSREIEST
jgi:hypothetical protein